MRTFLIINASLNLIIVNGRNVPLPVFFGIHRKEKYETKTSKTKYTNQAVHGSRDKNSSNDNKCFTSNEYEKCVVGSHWRRLEKKQLKRHEYVYVHISIFCVSVCWPKWSERSTNNRKTPTPPQNTNRKLSNQKQKKCVWKARKGTATNRREKTEKSKQSE